ncbi:MAG: hypothetical protein EBU09_09595 [Betaproteobacteria bacterium]|nr:hypothetical protein [Betaproteobacteria bacterium]
MKLFLIRNRAVLRDLCCAIGSLFGSQHVEHGDRGYGCNKQVGSFGDCAPHKHAPGAAAINPQPRGLGVALIDEPLRCGNAILPGIELGGLFPRFMPGASKIAAPADMRDRIKATALNPCKC